MVARFLASKKEFRFAMVIPTFKKGDYWELVQAGAEKATDELSNFNVHLEYLYFDQFNDQSFDELIPNLKENAYDGIIIATLHKDKVIKLSKMLDERKVVYVYIDSNIPQCNNLSYYGTDSHSSGSVAAKLMMTCVGRNDSIIIAHPIYKNNIISTQMENRELGFLNYLKQNKFEGKIEKIVYTPSSKNIKQLEQLTTQDKKIGIITFNSRIYEIIDLIEKLQLDFSNIHLIGYDPIEKNLNALKTNRLRYLISQRSVQQGYESVKALSNHIIFGNKSEKDNFMPIDILIKENISFYQD